MATLLSTTSAVLLPVPRLAFTAVGPLLALTTLAARELGLTLPALLSAGAFVLVLPGYVASLALSGPLRLTGAERLVLSIGLSIAIGILAGLILHLTPWGLTPGSWAVALSVVWITVGFKVTANCEHAFRLRIPRIPLQSMVLYVASATILFAAFIVAQQGFASQPHEGFTELWAVPVQQGRGGLIEVGLVSKERSPTSYEVTVLLDGVDAGTLSTNTLEPGQTWSTTIILDDTPAFDELVIEVRLAEAPDEVYRWVTFIDER